MTKNERKYQKRKKEKLRIFSFRILLHQNVARVLSMLFAWLQKEVTVADFDMSVRSKREI